MGAIRVWVLFKELHAALLGGEKLSPDLNEKKPFKCLLWGLSMTVLEVGLFWNQCVCVQRATVITAGGIRLSVTSKADSLITNAAKDLLVYQSEPGALPLPSGDGSYYHEPISPCDPDTLLAPAWSHQGSTKPPLMSLHACTSSDDVHAYTLYPVFFLYIQMFVGTQAWQQAKTERDICGDMYIHTDVYLLHTHTHTLSGKYKYTKHGPQRPACGRWTFYVLRQKRSWSREGEGRVGGGRKSAAGQILNVWLNQKVFSEPHQEIPTIWTQLPCS